MARRATRRLTLADLPGKKIDGFPVFMERGRVAIVSTRFDFILYVDGRPYAKYKTPTEAMHTDVWQSTYGGQ